MPRPDPYVIPPPPNAGPVSRWVYRNIPAILAAFAIGKFAFAGLEYYRDPAGMSLFLIPSWLYDGLLGVFLLGLAVAYHRLGRWRRQFLQDETE